MFQKLYKIINTAENTSPSEISRKTVTSNKPTKCSIYTSKYVFIAEVFFKIIFRQFLSFVPISKKRELFVWIKIEIYKYAAEKSRGMRESKW